MLRPLQALDLTTRGRATARPPLVADGIARLDFAYLSVTRALWRVAAEVGDVTWHLQVPKLPEALSASIAVAVAPQLSDGRYALHFSESRRVGDPDAWTVPLRSPGKRERCELKGTGARGWVSVGKVDRRADLVIWVDYAARLRDQRNRVRVLELPGEVFADARTDDCVLTDIESRATSTVFYDPWTRRVTELPRARVITQPPVGSWNGLSLN